MDSLKTNFHAPSANVWRKRIVMCSGHLRLRINSYNRLYYQSLANMFQISIYGLLAEDEAYFR